LGKLDLVGGFVEANEAVEAGMIRETEEELGVTPNIIKLLGVYGPDPYAYHGVTGYNTAVTYLLDIGDQKPKAADDAASIEWYPVSHLPEGSEMAFPSQVQFLSDIRQGKIIL
jgi:8-oxo-dGTP diphosphatase